MNSTSNVKEDHNNIVDGDFLCDFGYYTLVLEPLPGASPGHIAVGKSRDNQPVTDSLEKISDITRRDTLQGKAAGPPPVEAMPLREHKAGI